MQRVVWAHAGDFSQASPECLDFSDTGLKSHLLPPGALGSQDGPQSLSVPLLDCSRHCLSLTLRDRLHQPSGLEGRVSEGTLPARTLGCFPVGLQQTRQGLITSSLTCRGKRWSVICPRAETGRLYGCDAGGTIEMPIETSVAGVSLEGP